jgi:hypothetical protein
MAALLDHFDQVSIFGRSAGALLLILLLDWVFSAFHSYQEWRGAKGLCGVFLGPSSESGCLIGSGSCCSL